MTPGPLNQEGFNGKMMRPSDFSQHRERQATRGCECRRLRQISTKRDTLFFFLWKAPHDSRRTMKPGGMWRGNIKSVGGKCGIIYTLQITSKICSKDLTQLKGFAKIGIIFLPKSYLTYPLYFTYHFPPTPGCWKLKSLQMSFVEIKLAFVCKNSHYTPYNVHISICSSPYYCKTSAKQDYNYTQNSRKQSVYLL